MCNSNIRQTIKDFRLRHYEVAEQIGISETTFCVWLRTELTGERKKKVLQAIKELTEK